MRVEPSARFMHGTGEGGPHRLGRSSGLECDPVDRPEPGSPF